MAVVVGGLAFHWWWWRLPLPPLVVVVVASLGKNIIVLQKLHICGETLFLQKMATATHTPETSAQASPPIFGCWGHATHSSHTPCHIKEKRMVKAPIHPHATRTVKSLLEIVEIVTLSTRPDVRTTSQITRTTKAANNQTVPRHFALNTEHPSLYHPLEPPNVDRQITLAQNLDVVARSIHR